MKLDEHTLRLIAVGASVAANCLTCLQINLAEAVKCGAVEAELAQAIRVGQMVRHGAASKMDAFAAGLNPAVIPAAASTDNVCGCS